MPTYNKLVRDLVPDIIEKAGKKPIIRILENNEYIEALQGKFIEELEEYKQAADRNQALEELADLLEIVYSLAAYHGATKEELEAIRGKKAEERGGFEKRIFLMGVGSQTMKKYRVWFKVAFGACAIGYEVEADTKEEAKQKGEKIVARDYSKWEFIRVDDMQ